MVTKSTAQAGLSSHGADIVAAATLNLDAATGNFVRVTGSTGITAVTLSEGVQKTVLSTGAPLITNGGSLILVGGQNIQAAAGDFAVFVGYSGGAVYCSDYFPALQSASRSLIYAAPFDALAYSGMQVNGSYEVD